tara:strand:+ start:769 stop:1023 length:255 start_codon:yes stop_codon:yes gene_type:complete
MHNTKTYLVKVLIDGEEEELKNFGESEMEVLDNMVDIPSVEEVLEITDLSTGRKWEGGGSLATLRAIKAAVNEELTKDSNKEVH